MDIASIPPQVWQNGLIAGVLVIIIFGFIFGFIQGSPTVKRLVASYVALVTGLKETVDFLRTTVKSLTESVRLFAQQGDERAERDAINVETSQAMLKILNEIKDLATQNQVRVVDTTHEPDDTVDPPVNPRGRFYS